MKRIELKHLAPYLPYGLKGIEKSYKVIMELHGVNQHGFTLEDGDYDDLRRFKPILRPLSDLIKEIEVNGEKFVPNEAIKKLDKRYSVKGAENGFIMSYPYWIIQNLFEWHFDVFGLIEQGLAIDINTLEK